MEQLGNILIEKGKGYLTLDSNMLQRAQSAYFVQRLKNELQRLSGQASDIEEELNRALSSGKKKGKSEVENWFDEGKKIQTEFDQLQTRAPEGMGRYLPIEDPIGKILCKVRELIEQIHHFNGLVLDDSDNIGELWSPTKLFGEKFERDLERIWQCLVTDDISNIGIYGMGGVGKTTLVRRIEFNLLQKKYRVYWVTVSQEFSIKSLQDKIANVLGLTLSNVNEEDVRASILREAMSKKGKFVLILDDVWDDFRVEKVGISLAANKCRLILTTRSKDVCNRMHCQREFDVKTLDTNASWELFKHTLGCKVPAGVEEIAKSVAKECAGLPLGIVTLAGSMRGIEDIKEWRNVLDKLKECLIGHEKMERNVFSILEWSFNRLNQCQKHCFLYCALYPEDWKIETEQLVNLFIGAELMQRRDTRQSEFDEGHTILNQLVRVGLLEKTSDWGAREYVQMHELIRDMAIRITSGEFVQKIIDVPRFLVKSKGVKQNEWTEDLDAVSIWYMEEEIPADMSPKCPKLSTLLFRASNIKTIPDSFFRHMGGLKVLNLKGCTYLTELPNCVSEMVNLTALILQSCQKLEHVPPLGKLKQLRELNLSGSEINHIPEGLEELVRLESLEMVGNLEEEIPADMSPKCPKLLTLLFCYGKIKTIPDSFFRHMGGLKVLNLKGCKYLTELPNCVSEMVNLTALILQGCENLAYVPPLGKLKQLRELNLSCSGIEHIPEGLKELINLESLEMVGTNLEEIIPKGTLSELHRLKQLKLPVEVQVCDLEVLNQLNVFHGHLSFTDMCEPFKISRWPKPYSLALLVGGCSSAYLDWDAQDKSLVFDGCNFRRILDVALLPKDIQYLKFNECVVEQSDVFQILNSSNDLLHLTINSLEGVEFLLKASSPPSLDSELIAIPYAPLQNLKTLHLDDLPDLVGFFDYKLPLPPGTFSSLGIILISECHKMRKLFTVQLLQSFKNLQSLSVINCQGVEEIIGADEEEARGSPSTSSGPTNTLRKQPLPPGTFCFLESVWISGSDKMRKLFTVQLLQSLKNLKTLHVINCKELEEIIGADEEDARGIPSTSSGPTNALTLPQLSELSLSGLPRLKNICKATIICNSIQEITVSLCPNLKRLPLFLPINGGQPSPPNSLRVIRGRKEWWESLEWDDPNDKITLRPFFKETRW